MVGPLLVPPSGPILSFRLPKRGVESFMPPARQPTSLAAEGSPAATASATTTCGFLIFRFHHGRRWLTKVFLRWHAILRWVR